MATFTRMAIFALGAYDAFEDDTALIDENATDYVNENAVGEATGDVIGETEFRDEDL